MERKKKIENIILLVIYIFNPFFSFFINISVLLRRKKSRKFIYLLIVICLCILSYIYIPTYDQDISRRYFLYDIYSKITFKKLENILLNSEKVDFLYDILVYNMSKLGITRQLLPVFGIFLYYFSQLLILDEIYIQKRRTLQNINYIVFFILTSLLVSFISQIRGPIAAGLFFIGYYYDLKGKVEAYLFYLLSPLIHFGLIPYVLICLFYKMIYYILGRRVKMFKYLIFISIILRFNLERMLAIAFKGTIFERKVNSYLLETWANKSSDSMLVELGNNIFIILLIVIVLFPKKKYNIKLEGLICLMLSFLILNTISKTNTLRYIWYGQGVYLSYIYFVLEEYKFKRDNLITKKIIKISLIFLICFRIGTEILTKSYYPQVLITLNYEKNFLKNIFQLLGTEVSNNMFYYK